MRIWTKVISVGTVASGWVCHVSSRPWISCAYLHIDHLYLDGWCHQPLVGWHHWLNGHKFEQVLGVGDRQRSLACCSLWGGKELDMALYVYKESWYIKRTQFYIYIESRKIVLMNLYRRQHWRWLSRWRICLHCRRHRGWGFDPRVGKIPWRRAWHPTPVFWPGKFYGQRSLVGYSPKSHKSVGHVWMTECACTCLHTHTHTHARAQEMQT